MLALAGMVSDAWAKTDASATSFLAPPISMDADAILPDGMESPQDVVVVPTYVVGNDRDISGRKVTKMMGDAGIAVIYPDVGEPYRSVFMQIIDGIEQRARGAVSNFAIGSNVNLDELNESLRRQDARVVIALGRQGMKVASALDRRLDVVVGGVLTGGDDNLRFQQVNSLSPDPALLFSRLKAMMPGAKRVLTVYDPRQNEWLMQLARAAAAELGLELVAYQVQDLRGAMLAYQKIFSGVDNARDVLWLPQDVTAVEESTVMPYVLQEAWNANLAVFSSSVSHVKRGVLFSLYPDNVELGRHLAGDALGLLSSGGKDSSRLVPLREVLMAVNLRTAKHIGLRTERIRSIDMAFPEQ